MNAIDQASLRHTPVFLGLLQEQGLGSFAWNGPVNVQCDSTRKSDVTYLDLRNVPQGPFSSVRSTDHALLSPDHESMTDGEQTSNHGNTHVFTPIANELFERAPQFVHVKVRSFVLRVSVSMLSPGIHRFSVVWMVVRMSMRAGFIIS